MSDIYIYSGVLQEFSRAEGDLTGIPPEASLFCADMWKMLCSESGGEAVLIALLGAKDTREDIHAY